MNLKLPAALAICTFALSFATDAQVVIQGAATGITHIRSEVANQNKNYGNDVQMIVGRTSASPPGTIRGLLSFDLLGAIPQDAIITEITLTLVSLTRGGTPNTSGSVALNLYDLTGSFVEGGGDSIGADSSTTATWISRDATTDWATPGGDFTTLLSSANADPSTIADGSSLVFSSNSAFVAAAQSALSASEPLTMLLKLNDVSETENLRRAFFFVSDNPGGTGVGVAANAPKLTITYIPEPGTAALLLGGTSALLTLRRRRIA